MKGIVLAGGSGTRLHPMTLAVSKQLLPVYNKPMIYYPISILMLAGIRDILVITTPEEQHLFKRLLDDGSQFGVRFRYAAQDRPRGLAEAFMIAEDFICNDRVCLILGDNIFYGNHLEPLLIQARNKREGATLFGYEVKDPQRYGVVEIDEEGNAVSLEEKPREPKSNLAVTGLYFYDHKVVDIARAVRPSWRGELEITDVNKAYLELGQVSVNVMGRGFAWLDAGTYGSLMQASEFIEVLEERQGYVIAALEEIAYRKDFIPLEQLKLLGKALEKSAYGQYLLEFAEKEELKLSKKNLVFASN